MALDIREMSFQNVLNQILKPAGVKVGGFPDEIFIDMTDDEKEKWTCNICYLIVNDCRQCDNKHLFCSTCVFAWSMTYGENSQKCPLCRHEQKEYAENKDVNRCLHDKKVNCPEDNCAFKSPLKIFLMHSHGKLRFSNNHVDLESLRPARPHGARLLVLPTLEIGPGVTRSQRGSLIRNQLQQGRMMINQMMLLLHLEMQLRQQAISSFNESRESEVRIQRLDEVLALNEQLNEVGGILSGLLNTPLAARIPSAQRRTTNSSEASSAADVMAAGNTRTNSHNQASVVVPARSHIVFQDTDTEDEDTSDDDSSISSMATTYNGLGPSSADPDDDVPTTSSRPQVSRLGSTLREGQSALEQARQRRSTTHAVLTGSIDREPQVTASRSTDQQANSVSRSTNGQANSVSRSTNGQANSVHLLNRRQDHDRHVLSAARNREQTATQTDVQRIDNTMDTRNTQSGAGEGRHTAASVHLPSISQSSNLPDSPARNMESSVISETDDDDESTRNAHPIPRGSSVLSHVMRDLNQTRNQPITMRTSTTHNPTSDITITVTSSTPARRQEPDVTRPSNGRGQDASQNVTSGTSPQQITSEERDSRALSRNSSQTNRNVLGRQTNANQQNPRVVEGSILPPSLYRRRQQTQTNVLGGIEGDTSSTVPVKPPTEVHGSRRTSLSNRIPGQNTSRLTSRSVNTNSTYTGRSQHGLSNPPNSLSSRHLHPSRSSLTNNATARPRALNGPAVTKPRDPSDSVTNYAGARPRGLGARTGRPGQSNSTEGLARSRRRSEIHQQLLMRKDNQ